METLVLGGYTKRENKGISTVQLNASANRLEAVQLVAELEAPTYLEAIGDFIFSVVKEDNWAGIALLEKHHNMYLTVSNLLTENADTPCYVSFDRKRQLIYSAHYHQGFFEVAQITDEGLELLACVEHDGSSIHPNQQSSHVHYVQSDLTGEYILVCDLGTDEVYSYTISETGQLTEHSRYKTAAGFGPRHLVQHPTKPIVYIIGELNNSIDICLYEEGKLSILDNISLLPADYTDWSSGAAIRLSHDGRFLYASNRGHNSIVVYRVLENGLLQTIQWVDTLGKTPRDFNFNQTQEYIIVGHQDDDVLTLFTRNSETGELKAVHQVKSPECVCVSSIK